MSVVYKVRRFQAEDTEEVSSHSADVLIDRAKQGHMYVVCDHSRIVGCGGIAEIDEEQYYWLEKFR